MKRRHRERLRSALLVVGAATAMLFSSAAAATAAPAASAPAATTASTATSTSTSGTDGTCPTGSFCLFDEPEFTGERLVLPRSGECVNLADLGWDNRAQSVMNATWAVVSMFTWDNCGGGPNPMMPGMERPNFGSSVLSVYVPGL